MEILLDGINKYEPGLLAFFLALLALVYARREYKSKNYPVFVWSISSFTDQSGSYLSLNIINRASHPIKISVLRVSAKSHLSTVIPHFDSELSLPIEGERSMRLHLISDLEKQALLSVEKSPDVSHDSRRKFRSNVLELRLEAVANSILDKTKRLRWSVDFELEILEGGMIRSRTLRDDLVAIGGWAQLVASATNLLGRSRKMGA